MNHKSNLEKIKSDLLECLDETFESHHGIYLDKGTSLFETLEGISAEEASRRLIETGATIAAHTEHLRLYLDVLERAMRGEEIGKINWREIWETVGEMSPAEWQASVEKLKESHRRTIETIKNYDLWKHEDGFGAALGILTHTAYHLGAIRQVVSVIKRTEVLA